MPHNKRASRSFFDLFSVSPHNIDSANVPAPQSPPPPAPPYPPRRAPLAPIAQQVLPLPHSTMSAQSSPQSAVFPGPDADPYLAKSRAGRRSSHTSDELFGASATQRRKSQSHMVNPTRPLPYPPTKPPRRPLHAHSQSTSSSTSTRRTSLPTLPLHPPSIPTPPSPHSSASTHDNSENIGNDDLFNYSSLSSYTFGAASSESRRDYESDSLSPLSPLTTLSASADRRERGGVGDDHTPRPSISHPRNDEDDDDGEARRYNRAKMRAIDDGGRRPSLPTNLYSSASADEATCTSPSPSPFRDRSKQESQTSIDMDQDLSQDVGVIDTDVEYESGFDTASVHTFGMGRRGTRGMTTSRVWDLSDSEVDSESEAPLPHIMRPPSFLHTQPIDEDGSGQESTDDRRKSTGLEARRGSLPAAIPARTPTSPCFAIDEMDPGNRDREGSIATLRRPSRSVDDELRALNAGISGMGVLPPSLTDTRTTAPDRASNTAAQDTYAELDLAYIMDGITGGAPGSRRSSLSFVQPLSPPPQKEKGKGKDKSKSKGKDKGKGKTKQEFDPNDFGSPSALLDVAPWATDTTYPPRRPSTITISGDDTFAKGLRAADPNYTNSRLEWSFIRDPTTGPLPSPIPGAKPTKHEVWRCDHIGQVVVDRISVLTSDSTRPPQQRLNVSHKVDLTSIGNKLGGPACIIHKHSKATAFSIFRSYGLLDHRRSRNSNDPAHVSHTTLPTSNSFLLAPKKVQEQYTNTKSTKMLSTHGLLEDKGSHSRSREGSSRRVLPERGPIPFGDARAGQHIINPKDIPMIISSSPPEKTPSTSATTSLDVPRSSESSIPLITAEQRVLKEHTPPLDSSQSTVVPPVYPINVQAEEEESYSDSDLDRQATRTSHAEAFATLDPVSLEQYRARNPAATEKEVSVASWIKRQFRPGGTPRPAQTSFVDPINPPWMTLAPRGQQEEQDQVIKTLNTSFVDVGLLPSYKRKSAGIGRKGHSRNANVLTHVPDNALYMLLPLWPRETDSVTASQAPRNEDLEAPEVSERLYLLVYYVPFERRDKKSGALVADVPLAKKRSRSTQRRGESSTPLRSIVLDSFRAIARLMSYDDLRGSGVRLPARGLAVTGPMEDAMRGIPPAKLRDVHQDDFVIAICASRAAGRVEFLPDGLEKLGLCEPRTESGEVYHPAMQVRESEELEPQPLTAIGRAAVEMAWLGCMALTNFEGC